MNGFSRILAGVAAVAVVAAVGAFVLGSGPSIGGPGPTPTVAPSPTSGASPRATPSGAACGLLTSDDVRNASGNPGLGALPGPGGSGATTSCVYTTGGGDIMLRTDLTKPGGTTAFEAAQTIAGVETENGLGAEAVFDPATGTMYVLKGDAMAALVPGWPLETIEAKHAMARLLVPLLVPRL